MNSEKKDEKETRGEAKRALSYLKEPSKRESARDERSSIASAYAIGTDETGSVLATRRVKKK